MQVRDGPAAVRGDAPRRDATGPRPGRRRRREPRVRRPAALHNRTPRGRRIRASPHLSFSSPLVAALCSSPRPRSRRASRPGRRQDPDDLRRHRSRPSTAANALEALDAASLAGEFYYHVTTTSFGDVRRPDRPVRRRRQTGWVFKVNGKSPPVGADKVVLKDGDTVLWYWASSARPAGRRRSS